MGQYDLDPAFDPVEAKFRFPVSRFVGKAVLIVAEALPGGHAAAIKGSLFDDDLADEAAADLDDQEEIVDRLEGPYLEPFEAELAFGEAEELLDRPPQAIRLKRLLTPSLLRQSMFVM